MSGSRFVIFDSIKTKMMNFRRHLIPLLLLILPVGVFAQGNALKKMHDKYDKIRLRYFYESVIRAGANVALGEEGIELTKGIQKVITTDFEYSEATDGALEDLRQWLKEDNYETYIEVTNRGNLAGMASFFMNIIGQNGDEDSEESGSRLEDAINEMAVYAIDDGDTISSLVVMMIGDKSTQVYELDGELELKSVPELIERVQKFAEIIE